MLNISLGNMPYFRYTVLVLFLVGGARSNTCGLAWSDFCDGTTCVVTPATCAAILEPLLLGQLALHPSTIYINPWNMTCTPPACKSTTAPTGGSSLWIWNTPPMRISQSNLAILSLDPYQGIFFRADAVTAQASQGLYAAFVVDAPNVSLSEIKFTRDTTDAATIAGVNAQRHSALVLGSHSFTATKLSTTGYHALVSIDGDSLDVSGSSFTQLGTMASPYPIGTFPGGYGIVAFEWTGSVTVDGTVDIVASNAPVFSMNGTPASLLNLTTYGVPFVKHFGKKSQCTGSTSTPILLIVLIVLGVVLIVLGIILMIDRFCLGGKKRIKKS